MKKLLYSLLVVTALVSCSSDDLKLSPTNGLSTSTAIQTKSNVGMILTGAYDQTGHYYYLTIGQIALDDMGDDVMLSNGAFGYSPYKWNQYTYDYTQYARINDGWWSSYCSYFWREAYTAINQCNLIIENADNLPEGCEDYLAQAHGLRGWNFLNLYHLFCPAYLNKTLGGDNGKGLFLRLSSASSDKSTDVPRSDLKASMQQIIDDLTYAYEHCSSTSNYYINKKNAALFLARTYLEMGNYQKASEFAEIAASNTFDGSNLMSQEEYQAGFMTANSEWLWGFKFDSESTNIYASIPSFYHAATAMDANSTFGTANYGKQVPGEKVDDRVEYLANNAIDYLVGYGTIRIAKSFTDIFKKDENGVWTDCRALFPFYVDSKDGYFTAKFNNRSTLGVADFPMGRISEAYLIEAEAKMKLNDAATGLRVLNALQTKRGGTVSTEITIDEIWNERRRELYGEGFALTDLKRLNLPLHREGEDQWSSTKDLPADSPRMMFPIPDDELDYNPYYKNSTADYNKGQNDYWAR